MPAEHATHEGSRPAFAEPRTPSRGDPGLFRALVEFTDGIHWEFDFPSRRFTYVSPQSERVLGYRPEEWTGFEFWAGLVHEEDRQWATDYCLQQSFLGKDHEITYRMVAANGRTVWVRDIIHVVPGGEKPDRLVGIMLNVSDLKATETRLRREVSEKETLLREVHHRVKNNLSVVQHLLRMQSRSMHDAEGRSAMVECEGRIRSIALLHEHLYHREPGGRMPSRAYFEQLTSEVMRSCSPPQGGIRLLREMDEMSLDLDAIMPCGLLANEMLTNALKHGYAAGGPGVVRFSLRREGTRVRMSVVDDGVGLPDGFDHTKGSGFGLRIIHALVEQLCGSLSVRSDHGAAFEVSFEHPPRGEA